MKSVAVNGETRKAEYPVSASFANRSSGIVRFGFSIQGETANSCAKQDGQVWYGMPDRSETGSVASGTTSAEPSAPPQAHVGDYGLRGEALSPMETLAQSVSTIAPTSTPAATIPLVAALAGNGTWLAYLLATMAILLV